MSLLSFVYLRSYAFVLTFLEQFWLHPPLIETGLITLGKEFSNFFVFTTVASHTLLSTFERRFTRLKLGADFEVWEVDGALFRALASHQCGPGSIPAWCHMSVEFAVSSRFAARVFLRVLWTSQNVVISFKGNSEASLN